MSRVNESEGRATGWATLLARLYAVLARTPAPPCYTTLLQALRSARRDLVAASLSFVDCDIAGVTEDTTSSTLRCRYG